MVQLTHALLFGAPTVVEYVPAVQLAHIVAPADENDPATQEVHASDIFAPSMVENVPAKQLRQVALLGAPITVEKVPREQFVQTVAPVCENEPAEQLRQVSGDDALEAVENDPEPHSRHELLEFPATVEYVPEGQRWHSYAPAGDQVPGLQLRQALKDVLEYVAPSQSIHVLEPVMLEYLPAAQDLQDVEELDACSVEYVPETHPMHWAEEFEPITVE
jgi:hypothetical protein